MKRAILCGVALVALGDWAAALPPAAAVPVPEVPGGHHHQAPARTAASDALPTVDLGYALHRGTINETGQYYNFSNIRYATPPLGDLRFKAPIPPRGRNLTVNDGQQSAICPQASPGWQRITAEFILGNSNLTDLEEQAEEIRSSFPAIPTPGPTENEDCLLLDVITPVEAYSNGDSRRKRGGKGSDGAPVLVWIYGGGYTLGSKDTDPGGIMAQGKANGGEDIVYVSIGYRLGLFGWLSGPTFQEDGTANAGLYDQRLALNWVQHNIHLFGGDPSRVTVMGQSAGGGSIMHQITAYGGLKGEAPFSQAIVQSPAWHNLPGIAQQESLFNDVLAYASIVSNRSITTLDQLRALPTSTLQAVNAIAVGRSVYGTFSFGPTVDGRFVPALPSLLLFHGRFDPSVKVMVGHNQNESFLFTPPYITNHTQFASYISEVLPTISTLGLIYIEDSLYPAFYSGIYGYYNERTRVELMIAESTFTCNTRYLDRAFKNQTYSYYYTVPPAYHGMDIGYTFFNGDTSSANLGTHVDPEVAARFQSYLSSFVITGNPNEGGNSKPFFPLYGANSTVLVINSQNDGKIERDSVATWRCNWWQRGLYA